MVQETDNELKGQGVQYDYGFRIYDARLGKFLSVDPLTSNYPWYTPYQFAENKPIVAIDLDGLEELIVTEIDEDANGAVMIHVQTNENVSAGSNDHLYKVIYSYIKRDGQGNVLRNENGDPRRGTAEFDINGFNNSSFATLFDYQELNEILIPDTPGFSDHRTLTSMVNLIH